MKLITIRSQIVGVVDRWKKQYSNPKEGRLDVLKALQALDLEAVMPEDLERIIGNSSWACPQLCYECKRCFSALVEIGEDFGYNSCTTQICRECLQKALKLVERGSSFGNKAV